jgi:hypothetical protein
MQLSIRTTASDASASSLTTIPRRADKLTVDVEQDRLGWFLKCLSNGDRFAAIDE